MHTIVLGFDGTPAAFVALDWVAMRAAMQPSRVEIVSIGTADPLADDTLGAAFDEAERRVRDVAPDAEVSSRVARGRMPDALMDASAAADLLVIGAHHHGHVRSALRGWRPLRTVSQSRGPIVVVPDDWKATAGGVLVGVDDDDSSASAISFAVAEAKAAGVGLTLLHAWQTPVRTMDGSASTPTSPADVKKSHRRILDENLQRVVDADPGLHVDPILTRESPTSALLKEATRSALMVIGTHRRGILAAAFLGSVGLDVLVESRIPVCIVPAVPRKGTQS